MVGIYLSSVIDKSVIAVFSVVCPTKYLESNVKQFLMLYYFVPAMASSATGRI